MKKTLLIFLLMVITTTMVAQPRLRQPEMYVGMHGGVMFSLTMFTPKVSGSDKLTDRTLLSGNGGLVFRYNGHKYCGFQLELDYLQRGWRENTTASNGDPVHYQRRLNYFELPFMAHFYFGRKKVRFFVNLGPQIGVCFLDNWSGTQNTDSDKRKQYDPIDNKFDWGVTGGLGLLVRTNRVGTFQLEARYSYSLGDYYANRKTDYFSHSTPMTLSGNIGYLWEIKSKPRKSVREISNETL